MLPTVILRPADSPRDRPPNLPLGRRDFLGRLAAIGLGAGAIPGPCPPLLRGPPPTPHRSANSSCSSGVTSPQADPHAAKYMTDCRVVSNLFDTLVRRHPDGTLHPGLATAWQRAGPTTWHLTLRPDVRWHDGTRFTAIDAVQKPRPNVRSVREGSPPPAVVPDDRANRDARSGNARHPYQAAGRADPGSARRVGSRRPLGVHRPGGVHRVQPAPGGNRAAPLRVVDQGRAMRSRGQPRLLGWAPRPGPRGLSPRARPGGTRGRAASRRRGSHHAALTRAQPARGLESVDPAGRSALRRALRARGQCLGGAAQPAARPAGPVAGRRSGTRS